MAIGDAADAAAVVVTESITNVNIVPFRSAAPYIAELIAQANVVALTKAEDRLFAVVLKAVEPARSDGATCVLPVDHGAMIEPKSSMTNQSATLAECPISTETGRKVPAILTECVL